MTGFGNRTAPPGGSSSQFSPIKPPLPTVPKGGGALRPIGETFRTSPATGTFSYDVPLDLFANPTAGRTILAPALTITFDSGGGAGPFGGGWQVPISAVTRRTDKKLPTYSDDTDVFMLAGMGELTPAVRADVFDTPKHRVKRYRPRIESTFARIERWQHKQTGETHWVVTAHDNVKHVYGAAPQSRIADPADSKSVYSWLLARSEDDRGNIILYTYKFEDLVNVPWGAAESNRLKGSEPITNRYPKRIRFGNTVPFDTEGTSCRFEAVFDYGEHDPATPTPTEDPGRSWPVRQDPIRWCRAGFEIRTFRLCRRVLMFHRFAELGSEPTLVRSVDFTYDENPYLSKLTAITKKGYARPPGTVGPYTVKKAAEERFGYTADTIQTKVTRLGPDTSPIARELNHGAQWLDLDGAGAPGLFGTDRLALYYARNQGQGRLTPMRRLPSMPSYAAGKKALHVLDLEANGKKQMVFFEPPFSSSWERDPEKDRWTSHVRMTSVPNIDWNGPGLHFIDLNGDGRVDILAESANGYLWYPSIGKYGWDDPRVLPRPSSEERGPILGYRSLQQTIFLADMTGDGLTDIVRIENGRIAYWPNLGHGKFGAIVTMEDAPWFDNVESFDARRIRLGDVDGSGTADILYSSGSKGIVLWRNQAGCRWSKAIPLGAYAAPDARVDVVDLLGTGTASVVWSSSPWSSPGQAYYLDLMGGKKPHLLSSITNSMGLTVRLSYAPSTKFQRADRLEGRRWIGRLHFPMYLLERVESYDPVSGMRRVSESRYHDGYYDTEEREFCCFRLVEQVDTEAFRPKARPGSSPRPSPGTPSYPSRLCSRRRGSIQVCFVMVRRFTSRARRSGTRSIRTPPRRRGSFRIATRT